MPLDRTALEIPDDDLIARASSGDGEAFAMLFRRYQHVVYRFARSMTGRASLGEDIAQEVFLRLYAELPRYDPQRAAFSSYLYGMVRNLSRDRLRRERRFAPLSLLAASDRRVSREADPAEAFDADEAVATVRRALCRLPVKYRELIILCDLHDLSYAAAAAVVGSSVPAVRSRLHRARQLLRRQLEVGGAAENSRATATARCAI